MAGSAQRGDAAQTRHLHGRMRIVRGADSQLAAVVLAPTSDRPVTSQCEGMILLHEKMLESRLFFVDKLISMGARIVLCDPHRAIVSGPTRLRGQQVESPDIRAGMAMLLAALCADGESRINNAQQIERGYEHIESRLGKLGARIRRIEGRVVDRKP